MKHGCLFFFNLDSCKQSTNTGEELGGVEGRGEGCGLGNAKGVTRGWQGDDEAHQAVCAPPFHRLMPPPPDSIEEIKELCRRRRRGGRWFRAWCRGMGTRCLGVNYWIMRNNLLCLVRDIKMLLDTKESSSFTPHAFLKVCCLKCHCLVYHCLKEGVYFSPIILLFNISSCQLPWYECNRSYGSFIRLLLMMYELFPIGFSGQRQPANICCRSLKWQAKQPHCNGYKQLVHNLHNNDLTFNRLFFILKE